MDEKLLNILKPEFHAQMSELWEKAKGGDLTGLDDEKQRLVELMLDHEDELMAHLEHPDLTSGEEMDAGAEFDPFLHITIHSIIEEQLDYGDPIEVVEFFNAMCQKRYSRHDAIHLAGQILTCLIFEMSEHRKPFDLDTYRKLLAKYKTCNPQELADLLENEPLLSDDD